MSIKHKFGHALKQARLAKKLTQEDFEVVSSRTYVSTVERGIKSVTIEKLEDFSKVLNIHPLTLLGLAYLQDNQISPSQLMNIMKTELADTYKEFNND